MNQQSTIAVLGAGSWGTALAIQLARCGCSITLWDHDAERLAQLNEARINHRYLPGVEFPSNLNLQSNLLVAADTPNILIVVPSHAFRQVLDQIAPTLTSNSRIAWGSKGLDGESGQWLSEVASSIVEPTTPLAVVGGPTFAAEVAAGNPSAITVASANLDFANDLATSLSCHDFRAYTSSDMMGVQVGGAVKNVLAVAAGIADGLSFGANARAALISRGLAEMARLGLVLGAEQETFLGLAGVGDLVLTCTDDQSRNRRFGLAIGNGKSIEQAERDIDQVVEGYRTTRLIWQKAKTLKVDMPITEQTYQVLYQNKDPRDATLTLFERQLKSEAA
ncbi:MAG: NAD(P)-dependent glycerol-3-phosphate dehydrogenase [Gammaproteobacteria bacterium]|nr:NAD(P)-dependent glycerol-3-phosphate dehydrogenase [Gammaproteobacteria bacterium]